jgi:hypothetical protein
VYERMKNLKEPQEKHQCNGHNQQKVFDNAK